MIGPARRRRATWGGVIGLAVGAVAAVWLSGCAGLMRSRQADAAMLSRSQGEAFIRRHYRKQECQIPMRDGARLFTSIYAPRDASQTYPILLNRTPYSVRPYGPDAFRDNLGPSTHFATEGYIFVYQDVRGRYMSEGEFINMTPHRPVKTSVADVDESTDTHDTIEWLLANVANHNGRVGQWGISYPGFYAAAGMIDAHPALKAVSPQAPIADWYFDDFHHHGAFFLPHNFNFFAGFGRARPAPTTDGWARFDHGTPDGYQFFLDLGPLRNVNERHFKGEIAFWNEASRHPNYDAFWQSRNILPHLKNVAPAVMTVGGWYDAEDLYGSINTYRAIEAQNPPRPAAAPDTGTGIFNTIVMGPWVHGGWARTEGDRLGHIHFGEKHSLWYREHVELPFFNHFVKGAGALDLPEALMFETGANRWRRFDAWPPEAQCDAASLYLAAGGQLSMSEPAPAASSFDEFISDPRRPVPYTEAIAIGMTREYMTDDQRFAARRPDVLVYQTEVLDRDLTLAGAIVAELWVSTSQADADWVVKLIDVFPPDAKHPEGFEAARPLGGYQMMVRSEVIRGRFRDSYERPEPFTPGEPTRVEFELQDVLHTFKAGHRVMVQVQSTWFPLVDRNPQKWVDNIFEAEEADFTAATHRVYTAAPHASRLRISILRE